MESFVELNSSTLEAFPVESADDIVAVVAAADAVVEVLDRVLHESWNLNIAKSKWLEGERQACMKAMR